LAFDEIDLVMAELRDLRAAAGHDPLTDGRCVRTTPRAV